VIPEYYSTTQNRKNIDDDNSIGAIVKNPNKIAVAIVSIAAGILLLFIVIIVLIVKGIKRVRRKRRA